MNFLRTFALSLAVAISIALPASAQPGRPSAPSGIGLTVYSSYAFSGETELKSDHGRFQEVQVTQIEFGARQNLRLNETTSVSVSAEYENYDIDVGAFANPAPLPDTLQSLRTSAALRTRLNERWTLNSGLGVTSQVTDTGLLSEGWGANVRVLGSYAWTPTFTLTMGVLYNSLSEDWKIVPAIGFDWRFAERWSLAVGFPRAGLTYVARKDLRFSAGLSGSGGTFYVKDDPRRGQADGRLGDSKLQFTDFRVGLRAEWDINRTFGLNASIGKVVYRDFKYIDRGFRLRADNNPTFASFGGSISF